MSCGKQWFNAGSLSFVLISKIFHFVSSFYLNREMLLGAIFFLLNVWITVLSAVLPPLSVLVSGLGVLRSKNVFF